MIDQKYVFFQPMIEITRRCNLKCAHCLRGDPQEIVMSENVIDNFLDLAAVLGDVHITGGEPFADFPRLEYFIDGVIKRNLPIRKLSIVTNGTLIDDSCIGAFKRLQEHMKRIYEQGYKKDMPEDLIKSKVEIRISKDDYHLTDADKLYNHACSVLGDCCTVLLYGDGNAVKAIGRGKDIETAVYVNNHQSKIQVHGNGRKALCPSISADIADREDIKAYMIPCNVYLTAKGKLITIFDADYQEMDGDKYLVADFSSPCENLIGCIDAYNADKPLCGFMKDDNKDTVDIQKNIGVYAKSLHELNELKKSDNRYKDGYDRLADDLKSYEWKTAGKVAFPMIRSKAEIIAQAEFPHDKEKRTLKAAYEYLTKDEINVFYKHPENIRVNLRRINSGRMIDDEIKMLIEGIRKYSKVQLDNLDDAAVSDIMAVENPGQSTVSKDILLMFRNLYGNSSDWNIIKLYFLLKMQAAITNLDMSQSQFINNEHITVELLKKLITDNIVVFEKWNEYKKAHKAEYALDLKNQEISVKQLDTMNSAVAELVERISSLMLTLKDESYKALVNNIDDSFGRTHTYSDAAISLVDKIKIGVVTMTAQKVREQLQGGV